MNELTVLTDANGTTVYSCESCGFRYEWNDSDLAKSVANQLHDFHHANLDAALEA